jgi:cell division protein FtsW (lipid II flippase)
VSEVAPAIPLRPRRSASMSLLIFALVIVFAAFAQIGLALDGRLPAGMVGYGLGLGVLVAIAFAVTARFAPYADPLLLPLVTLLNGIGLAMIYRLDVGSTAKVKASTPNQLMWTALGVAFFTAVVLLLRDLRALQRLTYTVGALGLVLLILPIVPGIGKEINGSKIWIGIGGFSIQPGEFAKIALVVFFAGYLVNKRQALSIAGKKIGPMVLPRARDLGPILIAWAISVGVLVLEKDLGSSLLIFGLFVTMLYMATQRLSWMLIGLGLFSSGAFAGYFVFGHVQQRVDAWLNPDKYFGQIGGSDQLMQGLFAMAEGGVLGTGLGQGRPTLIPLNFSDFIFASIGEELGLTGAMVVLLLYGLIVQRGMKAAVQSRDPFAKLFTAGMSFVLALQVFVIVGGITRVIPLTGLTTPFLSQGGSSLLANWILIGILIRVSDAARRPAPQAIQDEGMTQVVRTS